MTELLGRHPSSTYAKFSGKKIFLESDSCGSMDFNKAAKNWILSIDIFQYNSNIAP